MWHSPCPLFPFSPQAHQVLVFAQPFKFNLNYEGRTGLVRGQGQVRNKQICRSGRSQQEEDVSDQGPVAVLDQQVCVTGNHQQSAAQKHPPLTLQDLRQPFWRPSWT